MKDVINEMTKLVLSLNPLDRGVVLKEVITAVSNVMQQESENAHKAFQDLPKIT